MSLIDISKDSNHYHLFQMRNKRDRFIFQSKMKIRKIKKQNTIKSLKKAAKIADYLDFIRSMSRRKV